MLYKFTNISLLSTFLILIFLSCTSSNEEKVESVKEPMIVPKDVVLERILTNGKLIATTDYNSTNYYVYRGEPLGYQYELLKSFADFLGVKLEIKIINDLEVSLNCINEKECDMIALGLTITKERLEYVDFSNPLIQTRQMLVQRKPEKWRKMATMDEIESKLLRNTLDLAGKTIHIQKNTIFESRLQTLSNEIGSDIIIVEHPEATVEELIDMVDKGEIEFTISDEYIALVNQKYFPDIDTKTPVSFPQNVAWAVKKGSTELLDTINYWLENFKQTRTSAYLYNKYFRNSRSINYARSEYHSVSGGKISPYDKIIKKQSEVIDWDWRLLASLIYQESRFYPDAKSWVGAFGLMQLMPHTAQKYGVDSLSPPEDQIKAGVKFIKLLDKQFLNKIEDKEERTKFVLASYNAGIAHVYDARRLAEKYDKDPNLWNENVDFYLLNKSKPEFYQDSVVKYGYCRGSEPYNFVYDILERFHHYQNTIVQ